MILLNMFSVLWSYTPFIPIVLRLGLFYSVSYFPDILYAAFGRLNVFLHQWVYFLYCIFSTWESLFHLMCSFAYVYICGSWSFSNKFCFYNSLGFNRTISNGWKTLKRLLKITSYQGNENLNDSEILSYTSKND